MTNAKEVYEAKILETLIKNAERLAVVETELKSVKQDVKKIDSKLNWLFGAVFAVGASILATLYAQPILTALGK